LLQNNIQIAGLRYFPGRKRMKFPDFQYLRTFHAIWRINRIERSQFKLCSSQKGHQLEHKILLTVQYDNTGSLGLYSGPVLDKPGCDLTAVRYGEHGISCSRKNPVGSLLWDIRQVVLG